MLIRRDETVIAVRDFGGDGPPVVFLHGLAGHAGEWAGTANALVPRFRVVAFDARGHGESEPRPSDVSRAAHVADTVAVIEALDLAPVVLVGQSLGGVTAFLTAAAHPELVRALVVAEAGPGAPDDPAGEARAVVEQLPAWAAAKPDWPSFELDIMERTLCEAFAHSYDEEWARVECPRLVVRAEDVPGAGHDLHLDRPAEWQAIIGDFLASLP